MYRRIATLLLCASFAAAQTNRGGFTGTVTDKTGGTVPNASVVITNFGTNETFHLKTGESGAFTSQNLDPVSYRIEVSAERWFR